METKAIETCIKLCGYSENDLYRSARAELAALVDEAARIPPFKRLVKCLEEHQHYLTEELAKEKKRADGPSAAVVQGERDANAMLTAKLEQAEADRNLLQRECEAMRPVVEAACRLARMKQYDAACLNEMEDACEAYEAQAGKAVGG